LENLKEETACEAQAKIDINVDEHIMWDDEEWTQLARDSLVSCENDNEYRCTKTAGIIFDNLRASRFLKSCR